ncbi:hypothetical protein AB0C33_21980 [Nonomuraea sp. NPDC048881]|uniref:hypothetical protein n=1 Tax=Nonomuraea sp. NPDC048881 TaxID=3155030 RepID=UPI0033FE2EAF
MSDVNSTPSNLQIIMRYVIILFILVVVIIWGPDASDKIITSMALIYAISGVAIKNVRELCA